MEKKQFDLANLSDMTLQQVRSLEKTLSEEKREEVVLVAYENHDNEKGETIYKG